jgi:two-component system response regulator YesN
MSLQTVASHVNVSSNHFSAIFRKETGETFIEYLTTVRMEKAKELLTCTAMKTSEVGFEVGYKDPHYFSFIFKRLQGMSPKEYRKSKKEA